MLAKPWAKLLRYRSDLAFGAAILLLIAAIGFASYQRLFSSFAMYDDEGYVIVSLRQFMAGRALYDEVYSQYGPAYYWLASLFHWVSDWPVTHDATRIKTLAVWITVSLLAAGCLYRVTRSRVMAAIGLLFVSFHLERLAMEPGHPQELCLLGVAACMFLATFVRRESTDIRVIAGLGCATALCLMTKVNVGIFLFISLSAALLLLTRASRLRSLLCAGVVAAMLALPIVIGRHELFGWHGYRLPVLMTTSIALSLWVCKQIELKPIFELRHALCFWVVTGLVSASIACCTLLSGTSLLGLADGLLLQHLSFVDIHYHDPPIYALAPIAALFAVVVAKGALANGQAIRVLHLVAMVVVIGAVLRHLVESFQPLYHGSQDRGHAGFLVSFFAVYAWSVLLPLRKRADEEHDPLQDTQFARLSLCLIAVVQPLIAFPVPGTQMAIGSVSLLVVLLAAIHDISKSIQYEKQNVRLPRRGFAIGLLGILLITILCRDLYLWNERSQLPSLRLEGASHLRLHAEFVATERWTVAQLRERADTFVCLPSGHNSLYLWSGIEPPTGFNATVWQDLLTDEHQRAIVAALEARQRVCIVVERDEPSSLRTHGPLLDFIRENFEPVAARGTREIWQRRPINREM